jgi:hypothetical protein
LLSYILVSTRYNEFSAKQEAPPVIRPSFRLALVLSGTLLIACQGDQNAPSEPDHGLDLTAGGGICKNGAFTSAVAIYSDASVQNDKLQACKDILAFNKNDQYDQFELGVNQLIVAVYNDYYADPSPLAAISGQTLLESVRNYIVAACGLANFPEGECLAPVDVDEDGTFEEWEFEGYLAAGPLFDGDSRKLISERFGFNVDEPFVDPLGEDPPGVDPNGPLFIVVSSQPREAAYAGDCPLDVASKWDCQEEYFLVDVDGLIPPNTVTVVSCEDPGFDAEVIHVRCPPGGCEQGVSSTTGPDLLCPAVIGLLPGWQRLVYQATRPVQWAIDAKPAYAAGTGTKFVAYTPIGLSDLDERRRQVFCEITSNFNNGSEGSLCQLLLGSSVHASCVTEVVAGTSNKSACEFLDSEGLPPLVPTDLNLLLTAAKTGGDGAYNFEADFTLGPADPERGESKTALINLLPPGKKKNR